MEEVVKRLTPKQETIRRLYLLSGNQCAFPECNHPIIVKEEYVAELCHICAAEKGGERFESAKTNEERRQFENLLFLCHDHHVITNNVTQYPPERLRQIKVDHESRFERGLASMEKAVSVQITNSNIFLGGEGGKSPGAGGGGGSAIGPGSTGGDGGPGGRAWDLNDLNLAELYETWNDSKDASAPGAGGGGASVVGQDATGGDGGGGGDLLKFCLDWEHLRRIGIINARVRVGEGGKNGCNGQPSGLDLVDEHDNVIISMNTPGGSKGGRLFSLTGQKQDPPQIIIEKRPRIMNAFLANSIENRDGLLFVLGGGWSEYRCPNIPYKVIWPLAIQAALCGVSPGGSFELSIAAIDPKGRNEFISKVTLTREYSGSPVLNFHLIPLEFEITIQGDWRISVRHDIKIKPPNNQSS